ncbi:hypothetical protein [Corallococcus sp. AS-1-6]|uniref:hypothetical protein n=1 Tax=Corallococcus sp. AS-1-6 TaxID=2874599 RepID=UPI001CBA9EEE|nr:hypothetical protein [Corallococcus sp. AS-1-6]MBZ4376726.1 hypothetical protein [Corallococcus sp. AS-1-6]
MRGRPKQQMTLFSLRTPGDRMPRFSVEGSLIEAWASLKSFRPKDEKDDKKELPDDKGNPTVNVHGQKRGNATHASATDPEARLCARG